MGEILATIKLITDLSTSVQHILTIMESEGRMPTDEEIQAWQARKNAAESDYFTELERRRNA